jgi:SAM-dependent methyltransferase
MPRFIKTVIPRIKKSFAERGFVASLFRSVLLPIHLFREYKISRGFLHNPERSDFDLRYGVETAGDIGDRTYLSDLDIPSPNWIYGKDYSGIAPERFLAIISSLNLRCEEFTFIDFGSGKGRALLLASEFPFKRIIGIEFSPELHAIAQRNIVKYSSPQQKCNSIESVCSDFTSFPLPHDPCLLYFFDPCYEAALAQTLENIRKSLQEYPRQICVVYISPVYGHLLDKADFLQKSVRNEEYFFSLYEGAWHESRTNEKT